MKLLPSVVLLLPALAHVRGEDLFTSLSYLQRLLRTEAAAFDVIRYHLEAEDARLQALAQIHRDITQGRPALTEIRQPATQYKIVANYVRNIRQELSLTIGHHKSNVHSLTLLTNESTWPTDDDLEGSAVGLCRLVDTYNVSLGRMIMLRSPALPEPTASDYAELASICLQDRYTEVAANWARLAIAEGRRSVWKAGTDILSRALSSLGNNEDALNVSRKNLARPPESPGVMLLKSKLHTGLTGKKTKIAPKNKDAASFQSLCVAEGDVRSPLDVSKSLRCRMATGGGNALLLLQPIRMEPVFVDPKIVLFHDFLSRAECKAIRNTAGPHLFRAYVNINSTNQYAKIRISKVAFLRDNHASVLSSITRRISLVTGLSMESAEEYQVVNYGVGGHYTPHLDFILKGSAGFRSYGPDAQRIATFLIYLSDVVSGGGTAFVSPRIAVKPRMGMAVFWFNLVRPKNANYADEFNWNEARKGDTRTMHGSCPVLHGSKWIATKWIHEKGQGVVNYDMY